MQVTLDLAGSLIVVGAFLGQSVAVIWWASKMTSKLGTIDGSLKDLWESHVALRDKVALNEEAALNREIKRLEKENETLATMLRGSGVRNAN